MNKKCNDCVPVSIAALTGAKKSDITKHVKVTNKGVRSSSWMSKQKELGIEYHELKKPKLVADFQLQNIAKNYPEGAVFRIKEAVMKNGKFVVKNPNKSHLMHMNQKGKLTSGENKELLDKLVVLTGVVTKAK